jgi:putative tricarboxylic transport membrane protein
MPSRGWRGVLPYLGALCVSALVYLLAGKIDFTPRPGTLGPDFWPKMAALLIGAAALFELLRQFVTSVLGGDDEDTAGPAPANPDEPPEAPRTHAAALAAGIALTIIYALVLPVFGFMLASFLLLVAFMYLGGIRHHLAVWGTAALGIFAFAFVFLKVAYISLPRGEPPFEQVTQFVMTVLQVR